MSLHFFKIKNSFSLILRNKELNITGLKKLENFRLWMKGS